MKKNILFLLAFVLMLSSCNFKNSGETDRLKAQNDSLVEAKAKLESEVNEYISAMNEVQTNIDKIKDMQNTISVQPLSENTPEDVRKKVAEDMAYLNEMIKTNRQELNNLRSRLKRSSFKLADVEKTLAQLTKSLETESAKVIALQMQVHQKDSLINTLNETVSDLGKNVEDLAAKTVEQDTKISRQDEALHTAWYAIGSKKELKENKIITSEGMFSVQKVLQSDFNKNYFVKIDARNTKQIPLYSTSKAKILTSHPKSSYTLGKENDNYVIFITDPADFWSISKYLVVEVD